VADTSVSEQVHNASRPLTEREQRADKLTHSLDVPVTVLGAAALLLWLAEPATVGTDWDVAVEVLWGLVWAVFLTEFLARAVAATNTLQFMRRYWWELVFLIVPFLRFTRALRVARAGRGLRSALRSTRSAPAQLRERLVWLGAVTAIVAAASGRLLWEFGGAVYRRSYADALHDGALSTLKGDPLMGGDFADVLEIALAVYSGLYRGGTRRDGGNVLCGAPASPRRGLSRDCRSQDEALNHAMPHRVTRCCNPLHDETSAGRVCRVLVRRM
jgi:voltage-gated potassium channel